MEQETRRLHHLKNSKILLSKAKPRKGQGKDGDIIINRSGSVVKLYVKAHGAWYSTSLVKEAG